MCSPSFVASTRADRPSSGAEATQLPRRRAVTMNRGLDLVEGVLSWKHAPGWLALELVTVRCGSAGLAVLFELVRMELTSRVVP